MENTAKCTTTMNGRTYLHTTDSGLEYWKDDATGEIITAQNPKNFKILSVKQEEAFKKQLAKRKAIENGRSKNWVACYHVAIKSLSSKLSLEEMGVVFLLLPYMNLRKDGELTFRGERMTVKEIAKAIGKSEIQAKRLLQKIVEVGVMYNNGRGKQ